jgi:hypothetical protein
MSSETVGVDVHSALDRHVRRPGVHDVEQGVVAADAEQEGAEELFGPGVLGTLGGATICDAMYMDPPLARIGLTEAEVRTL